MMKKTLAFALLNACVVAPAYADYQGSSFNQLWSKVKSDPYTATGYPHYKTNLNDLYSEPQTLLHDSRRNLSTDDDLIAPIQKLIHPIGICLAGSWNITAPTKWTGYFSQGSKALLIARFSENSGQELTTDLRSFGLAGKLFPTLDPNQVVKTANFHTISDTGGTIIPHALDAVLNNDIINVNPVGAVFQAVNGSAIATTFAEAEHTADLTQGAIRQVYPIAKLGLPSDATYKAPIWVRFVATSDLPRNNSKDFRDELNIKNYPNGLRYDIFAADTGTRIPDVKAWQKIGYLEFYDSVVGSTCDHSLHFHHAPWVGPAPATLVGTGTS